MRRHGKYPRLNIVAQSLSDAVPEKPATHHQQHPTKRSSKPVRSFAVAALGRQTQQCDEASQSVESIHLMAQGRSDARWMTYKQAAAVGAQVRKGEKGTPVQYWKFSEEQDKLDDSGRPVLDAKGQPVKETVMLERPRVFFATVFNGEQIDGLPPLQPKKEQTWNAVERAEHILKASGATITHAAGDRAFYRPSTDSITLPERGQFPSSDRYYATALHELGHWTGHASRLDRDLAHPFGSEGYAKEELRAEIASMIVGDELGIGHDPGQHAAYVGSWIKALQDEPLEVFRAAADAEKIHDYVLAFEQKQVQEQDQQQSQAQDEAVAQALAVDIAEVLDNPDVSFSHYQAFQGDTLEDALRSRGLETVGSITGTDPEQFYAVAHDRLSPVFGIDPSHTDTDNAYLERKGLAQEFANMAEQLHLAQQLQQHGEQIVSSIDAEARWSDGQRIFAFHDQDGEPHQVRSLDELNNYAPDQLMALPALTQQQAAVADQEANMTPPTNDQAAALLAAHPADAVQGIEQAAAARRQLAAGEIDGQAFADATRQHLGVELPPDWSGELRIVGVAEQDGQTVDAAQAGIEPQAFQVYARKADAQFGEDAFAFVAGKLGLALHIGFLRMSGRLLGAFRVIPVALWRHLGNELGIAAPEVASLRAMYERGRTLFDHQQVACTVLGFQWMSEHQRRSLVRELRDEVARCADRDQLLVRARQWLYKNKLVIVHERAIRTLIAAALAQLEVETGTAIAASVDPATLDRWRASVSELRPDGQTQQSWLWAAPAKHSTRQISEVLERIDLLYTLDVHKHLADIPDLILRRYARRLVSRPPSAGAKIKEPARTVEVACFLRYCLFTTTDQLILMVQRRIADLWRQAAADVPATVNWAAMYKTLLGELVALSAQGAVPDAELRARLEALITETQKRKPPSRASLVREGLIDGIRPVRSLLVAIAKLGAFVEDALSEQDAAASGDDLVEVDGALEPAFLDDEGPSADIPPFITTTNARELYDLRPGETVAQAAARKASEG